MDIFIDVLIGVSMLVVLGSLGLGLYGMARGGDYAATNGNRFMRWRVWAQTIAIGLLAVSMLYKAAH